MARAARALAGRYTLCEQASRAAREGLYWFSNLSPEISDTVCVWGRLPLTIDFTYLRTGSLLVLLSRPRSSPFLFLSLSSYLIILHDLHYLIWPTFLTHMRFINTLGTAHTHSSCLMLTLFRLFTFLASALNIGQVQASFPCSVPVTAPVVPTPFLHQRACALPCFSFFQSRTCPFSCPCANSVFVSRESIALYLFCAVWGYSHCARMSAHIYARSSPPPNHIPQ